MVVSLYACLLDLDLDGIADSIGKSKCDRKAELALHGGCAGSEPCRKQDIDLIQSWNRGLRSRELHDRTHAADGTLRVLRKRDAAESCSVKTQINGLAAGEIDRNQGALAGTCTPENVGWLLRSIRANPHGRGGCRALALPVGGENRRSNQGHWGGVSGFH